MEIREVRAFEGPNLHSHHPVIEMKVDLQRHEGRFTDEMPAFRRRLLDLLPSLREHHCSRGHPGGFCERLEEGTLLGHVVEHVALEVQVLAGCDVVYGKTRRVKGSVYNVVFEHTCAPAGERAGREAVSLVRALLEGRRRDVALSVDSVRRLEARYGLGPSTRAIAEAARRRGIPVTRLGDGSWLRLGYGSAQRLVRAGLTSDTPALAVDLAADKALTKELLREAGLPVPPGAVVTSAGAAVAAALRLGFPVAVKPCDANHGRGVSLALASAEEVRAAYHHARIHSDRVIVERFLPGRQYRALVVGGRLVAAAERIPAHVVGDGATSVEGLVRRANGDPRRGEGHARPLTRLRLDAAARRLLLRQGLRADDVPDPDRRVDLSEGANLSTGGTAVDVTDLVHPEVAEACRRAAVVAGLDVCGVDLVCPDIARASGDGTWAIIEINASPGLRMHLFPAEGRPRAVGRAVVDHLFPGGRPHSIPSVAVTGTNGKTTTTLLVGHMLASSGLRVGMATTEGVFVGGRRRWGGDSAGPRSARAVLADPEVDAAVLEVARGGILRGGLGFECCNVAVVTNVTEDHLGQDGVETLEDLVDVKSLVVETVGRDGTAVLNAENPLVMSMADRCRGRVCLFSPSGDSAEVRRHLAQGGLAALVRGGAVLWCDGRRETLLCPVEDVAVAWGGRAPHNIENALAAAAAAMVLGLDAGVVGGSLRRFARSPEDNPGRLEVMRAGGRTVVVDYGHNAAAIRATLQVVRHLAGRGALVGVLGVPGDRGSDSIVAVGRVAGPLLDFVLVKEDSDLRGRAPGEVASLLRQGVLQAGVSPERVEVVLDEAAAVRRAWDRCPPGGALAVFFEKRAAVLEALRQAERSSWPQEAVRGPAGREPGGEPVAERPTVRTGAGDPAAALPLG